MRKSMKYLKIVPLMMLLMFTLSGCVSLQDLRDEHAFWKDSTKKAILWQEKEYVFLTDMDDSYFSPQYNFNDYINITEADVPVLLAGIEGEFGNVSTDRKFINVYQEVYCIESEYEEMKKLLEDTPEMNHYAYQYYANDDFSTSCFRVLDEETSEIFEKILKDSEEAGYTEYNYEDNLDIEIMFITEICQSSENGLFSNYIDIDLNKNEDGEYMFSKYEGEYCGRVVIPEQYQDDIAEIFADAIVTSEEAGY